jgi:hypothetical protein
MLAEPQNRHFKRFQVCLFSFCLRQAFPSKDLNGFYLAPEPARFEFSTIASGVNRALQLSSRRLASLRLKFKLARLQSRLPPAPLW